MSGSENSATASKWFGRPLLAAILVLTFFGLTACATTTSLEVHWFEFNVLEDSPGVELLDYRYGDSRSPGARPEPGDLIRGRIPQRGAISGAMLRGDFLYAKWRNKATGKVYEETVDLRGRLPADIDHQRIYFVIKGAQLSQLYVYLIRKERRSPDIAPNGPRIYDYLNVMTIYPDQPESKNTSTRGESK